MKTLKEIKSILREHKGEVGEKYKVSEIGVFGSFVRGEQKRGSDIDILVDFYEIPDLLEFIDLEDHLRKLLGKKVDLIDKQGLKPQLKNIILKEVIYI